MGIHLVGKTSFARCPLLKLRNYPMRKNIAFSSSDGLKLAGVWDLPDKPTTKAIVLAHGITVDKDENGIFIELAKRLVNEGFAVFRFDFRGHGESEGKSIDLTISGELRDLEAAMREVKSKKYQEIGLLGASVGGGTCALYTSAHEQEITCLCLWNPALNYDHTFLNPTSPWIRKQKEHMVKDIQEKSWTTLGSRKFVIGKALFDDMAKLKPFEALKHITVPTLILHGTKDTKVSYEDSKEYVHLLTNGKLIILEGAEHGFHRDWETKRALDETASFFQKNM